MRKLTLYPRMGESNVRHIQSIVGKPLPNGFVSFMKENAGLSHYERIFHDANNTEWEVKKYLTYVEIFKLTDEFIREYNKRLIPFAFDLGGWHYCLSMDEDTFGKIIVNRWTDHESNDQFIIIADSFEEFINGLERSKTEY